MPQLRRERSEYSCTERPQTRWPAGNRRGLKAALGCNDESQLARKSGIERHFEAVIAQRQVARQREGAARDTRVHRFPPVLFRARAWRALLASRPALSPFSSRTRPRNRSSHPGPWAPRSAHLPYHFVSSRRTGGARPRPARRLELAQLGAVPLRFLSSHRRPWRQRLPPATRARSARGSTAVVEV